MQLHFGGSSKISGIKYIVGPKLNLNPSLYISLHIQLDDLKQQIVLEVTQAELRLRAAHVRLDVALDQVEQAREDYRIAMKRYQAQVDTNLNVLDAQNALIRSRFEYVDAVYDIAAAQANLIYAFGDDQPQRQTEPLK